MSLHLRLLHQASLHQASLRQASLRQANLRQASLHQASLRQASLRQASLRQASLRPSGLLQSRLRLACVTSVSLLKATLRATALVPKAPVQGARLAVILGITVMMLAAPAPAAAFETRAEAAWVFDQTTHTVLLDKNADMQLPPASMSKLMTLNMLFEALRDGRVTLDTEFRVSARAMAMEGSTMFLDETDRPRVEDLIKGIIVQSGNDACVVVAEGLAGSEDAFARLMTERAHALGMVNSTFTNASGWPDPRHRMTMHDLGLLAVRLIEEFPEYYGYFALTEFVYEGRSPDNGNNRNPLLDIGIGADGLKTGHTTEAGYGLVGSAVQGGRRVVVVITGLDSDAARAEEAESLLGWAFRQFAMKTVARAGTRIADARVFMGAKDVVPLMVQGDLTVLVPALVQDQVQADVVYQGPVKAPVEAGQVIGTLRIDLPDVADVEVPLIAGAAVGKGGFFTRVTAAVSSLSRRIGGSAAGL